MTQRIFFPSGAKRDHSDSLDGLPAGPAMPSVLQAMGWALRPLPFLERCQSRFGTSFTLRVRARSPWVILSEPSDVKRLFTSAAEAVRPAAVEANPVLGPLLGARSVMLLDEPEHMTHRRLMLPSFSGPRVRRYETIVKEAAEREIEQWPIGEPFALWPRMQAISTEVIIRAVFGDIDEARLERLRTALANLGKWLNDPRRLAVLMSLGPGRLERSAGFRAAMGPVEQAIMGEVERRHSRAYRAQTEDILSMLEHAHAAEGTPMSRGETRDELVTLLSDGPTATSLAWAFERLLRHPDKLDRLREEALNGKDDTYADAVVKETLRLCPIVPLVMRELVEPMELGGRNLAAGTTVAPSVYLIHRREDIYPRARSFIPERFLEQPSTAYAWIPFGGGVRRCLAASFAQIAVKRVIQTVLREVELDAASITSPEGSARSSVAFVPGDSALAVVTRKRGKGARGSSGSSSAMRHPAMQP